MTGIMAGATEMPRFCDINDLRWQRSPNTATVAKGLFGAVATWHGWEVRFALADATTERMCAAHRRLSGAGIHVGFI